MRLAALTLIGSLALAAVPASANATPALPNLPAPAAANLTLASGGCGPAYHPDGWGNCVPNYGYGYYGGPYYSGGYYHPYWHHWHHWHHWF